LTTITGLPSDQHAALRVTPMPSDTNAAGDIFGGWLMGQVDIAGSIVAIQRAQGRVVTVAVNRFQFYHPVFIGDLVSCYADVIDTGRTSISVAVDVYASRQRQLQQSVKVASAQLTYVAVDENREKRVLPKI